MNASNIFFACPYFALNIASSKKSFITLGLKTELLLPFVASRLILDVPTHLPEYRSAYCSNFFASAPGSVQLIYFLTSIGVLSTIVELLSGKKFLFVSMVLLKKHSGLLSAKFLSVLIWNFSPFKRSI